MESKPNGVSTLWCFVALFIVAVVLNYCWEISQSLLFVGMKYNKAMWWHCFVASLGDGILVWIIYLTVWAAFRQSNWFVHLGGSHYGVMLAAGLVMGVAIEWVALHILNRWAYTEQMPLIPGLAIGLAPVLQMLILPPVIFSIVAAWAKRRIAHANQSSGPNLDRS